VARGKAISSYLYHMDLSTRKPSSYQTKNVTVTAQTFIANEPAQSWETWHQCFGHISYSGLQKLHDLKLTDGFNVNTCTAKPDCITCTEAKQLKEPFNKITKCNTKSGELTHIDLWGKYSIHSLQEQQYYIVFVDDAAQWIGVDFLKEKNQAGRMVKNYLTHLINQGKQPKSI